jgi:hypothetical protein
LYKNKTSNSIVKGVVKRALWIMQSMKRKQEKR